jgi:hypothetical protein
MRRTATGQLQTLAPAAYALPAADRDDLKLSIAACEIARRVAPYRLVDNASRTRKQSGLDLQFSADYLSVF